MYDLWKTTAPTDLDDLLADDAPESAPPAAPRPSAPMVEGMADDDIDF